MKKWLYSVLVAGVLAVSFVTSNDVANAISLIVKPYTFTLNTKAEPDKVNSDFDTVYSGTNAAIGALNTAAGTKSTLAGRLAVSMNADGTFKNISGVTAGSQWMNPGLLQTYSSAKMFYVTGSDQTDIYLQYRRVKAILASSTEYSEVASSVYSGGKTIVTLADTILTDPVTTIEHSILTPTASGNSALGLNMLPVAAFATAAQGVKADNAQPLATAINTGNIASQAVATATNATGTGNIPKVYGTGAIFTHGKVNANGTKAYGTGFTSVKNTTGNYTITFSDGAVNERSTTASPIAGGDVTAAVSSSAAACTVLTYSAGSAADTGFEFISIGRN